MSTSTRGRLGNRAAAMPDSPQASVLLAVAADGHAGVKSRASPQAMRCPGPTGCVVGVGCDLGSVKPLGWGWSNERHYDAKTADS